MKRMILMTLLAVVLAQGALAQKKAEIKFDKTTIDFGNFPASDGLKQGTFTFTNTGNAPLIIHEALPSCGCTVATYTKEPVAPGGTGVVNVTYDGRKFWPGQFKKTVTVRTNATTEKVRLVICGFMDE